MKASNINIATKNINPVPIPKMIPRCIIDIGLTYSNAAIPVNKETTSDNAKIQYLDLRFNLM
jgi:hypothetical protein